MKEVLAAPAGSSAPASANGGLGPPAGPPAKHPLTGLTPGDHHRHYCKKKINHFTNEANSVPEPLSLTP